MEYFVDGYNLLFYQNRGDFSLEKSRENFIERLSDSIDYIRLDVSLFFDGRFRLGEGSLSHFKQLRILYSAHGETADELILSELEDHTAANRVTVVTSDRELAFLSRQRKAKTLPVSSFLKMLDKKLAKRPPAPPVMKKPPVKKPKRELEQLSTMPQSLFEYYLEVFENRYEEEYTPKESSPSDYERWLRAFENDE